jgi:hypothetical protein
VREKKRKKNRLSSRLHYLTSHLSYLLPNPPLGSNHRVVPFRSANTSGTPPSSLPSPRASSLLDSLLYSIHLHLLGRTCRHHHLTITLTALCSPRILRSFRSDLPWFPFVASLLFTGTLRFLFAHTLHTFSFPTGPLCLVHPYRATSSAITPLRPSSSSVQQLLLKKKIHPSSME